MLRLLPPRLEDDPKLRLLLDGALMLREPDDERVENDGELERGLETLGALRWCDGAVDRTVERELLLGGEYERELLAGGEYERTVERDELAGGE